MTRIFCLRSGSLTMLNLQRLASGRSPKTEDEEEVLKDPGTLPYPSAYSFLAIISSSLYARGGGKMTDCIMSHSNIDLETSI